jgi:hypothetical protein
MDSKYTVVQLSGAHNFYWVSIVHTILPSFTLPPTAPGHKKNKTKNKLFHVQIKKKIPVGCQIFPRIRRIGKHIRFAQSSGCRNGKPMGCKYAIIQSSGRVWNVPEVSEETGRGLSARTILESAAGRRNR